jgi:hypothetical protein
VPCFADEAAAEAEVFVEAEGEPDVRGVVCALTNVQKATAATLTLLMRYVLVFIIWFLLEFKSLTNLSKWGDQPQFSFNGLMFLVARASALSIDEKLAGRANLGIR